VGECHCEWTVARLEKKTNTVTSVGTRNMYQGRERALSYNHPKSVDV
jgi:hypothetical protein